MCTCYSKDCPEWAKLKQITRISFSVSKQIVGRQAVPGSTSASLRNGTSYAKATVSATSRATLYVEIQTDFTWPPDCKYPIVCSLFGWGHSKGSATQTNSVDSVFVEAGGQPLAASEIRIPQTGDKSQRPETKLLIRDLEQYVMCS